MGHKPRRRQAKRSSRAEELSRELGLCSLNVESGLYSVVAVSDVEVTLADGVSPASSCIYYMLTQDAPQNHLHWTSCDDYHVLIEGGPADYYLFFEDGTAERRTLGRDVARCERPVVACPGGTTKAVVLREQAAYVLVGSVLSPAWSPQRSRIGGDADFVGRYAGAAEWATPTFLKRLIGKNFGQRIGGGCELELMVDAAGQILWQGMQLTDKQLRHELRRHVSNGHRRLRISVTMGAPPSVVGHAVLCAEQAGVTEIIEAQGALRS